MICIAEDISSGWCLSLWANVRHLAYLAPFLRQQKLARPVSLQVDSAIKGVFRLVLSKGATLSEGRMVPLLT